jgi:multiple sugar transport system permease protein
MVDSAISAPHETTASGSRAGLRRAMQRKSTVAFFMALPLILLIVLLVIYPAFYSLHLATLN